MNFINFVMWYIINSIFDMKLKTFLFFSICFLLTFNCNAQIFYKINGNGLEKPSFIFGTHHLAPLSFLDSINGLQDALNQSDAIVGEIDLTLPQMELAMKMQQYTMAPADSTLSKLLSPEEFEQANNKFKNLKISMMPGIDLNMLGMMRPMTITSLISLDIINKQMPGFNPEQQLDKYFQTEGKKTGKKIIALETPEFQGKLLYTSIPLTTQAKNLLKLLDNPEKAVDSAKELNQKYLSQDLEGLEKLSNEEMDSESEAFMNALLYKRNSDWLDKLPTILKENSCFIAVGALHLAGEKGILEGLRKLGYNVEPIK